MALTPEEIRYTLERRTAPELMQIIYEACLELKKRNQLAPQRQSNADKTVSDIYHQIENTAFNARDGWGFAKSLQDTLRLRRNAKNDVEILSNAVAWVDNREEALRRILKRFENWHYWDISEVEPDEAAD